MFRIRCLATTAAVAIGLGAWSSAQAQEVQGPAVADAADTVERIVVTAQKREQDLIDVPINISVATQETLDLLGTDDIEEYANFVPGLEVQAQSLNTSSYALRGVTSDGGRPRVAVFENGVSIGAPRFGANTAMFDLERIEVVKGPQATLFGQGALVGGINFIQNRANLTKEEGWFKYDAGDYAYMRAEAGYNFVADETLAIRLSGLIKNRDGYVPNASNGPPMMGQDVTAFRGAIAWKPADTLRADLFLNYEEDASTGTQFKSGVFPPAGGDLSPFTATANNIVPEQMRDVLGSDREIWSQTLNVAWDINDAWTLTSLTGHRYLNNLEAFDSDGSDMTLLQFATVDGANVWSQELRMNYDAGGPVTGFFGANWYTQEASNRLRLVTDESRAQAFLSGTILSAINASLPAGAPRFTVASFEATLAQLGVPGAANFDNVVNPLNYSAVIALQSYLATGRPTLVPLSRHVEESFSNGKQTSYDIFGDMTWDVTEKLSLTAGLRYTVDELESDTLVYLVRGNPAIRGGAGNAVTNGTTLVSTDSLGKADRRSYDTDGELTWRLNAAYRVADDLNTWAAVGRGRRPPSLSSRKCAPVGPNCDAETNRTGFEVVSQEIYDNVEVGASGVFFDNRLRATASTYYGMYKDFQTTRYDVSQGSFVTQNSGNATTYGVEFEGQFRAADFLDLLGSYAFSHARYDDEDSDGNPLEFAGNTFRMSPEHTFSVAADLHFKVGDAGKVYFVPTYTWKDDQFFEDDNDANEFQEAYGLLDLKLGFDAGRWGVNVYLQNALDEEYLIDGGNTGGEFGIPTYIRGVPRMFGAGVNVKF